MEAREQLHDILWEGLQVDIFKGDQALQLVRFIGTHADKINEAKFGAIFGPLQDVFTDAAILSVNRLYDKPKGFEVRSIPSTIDFIMGHGDNLKIEQRLPITRKLSGLGHDADELNKLSDAQITKMIARHFDKSLPRVALTHANALSKGLNALKTRRDKTIAHPEAVELSSLPIATFADMDQLLVYAKDFIHTVGFGYLSIIYKTDDDEYVLARDAGDATRALERLIAMAGITSRNAD
jgi:hypothetical protein